MEEIDRLRNENEKLKKMNENKSDLISISAHQLRTSLSALKWIFKMFLNKELGDINAEQEKYLNKALLSNERTIALVNDLLTLNHSDDTSIAFKYKKVDIENMIEQVMAEFQGEVKNKNIELVFAKPETTIPSVTCDEEMIIVVLQNLIENAIKYSSTNSQVTISFSHDVKNNSIILSVHDQGIGIKKDDQIKIFNKFFRAPNAIEKEVVGSGLGLFTTKSIVERHNGKIWFDSSEETGTTFFVVLHIA